MLVRNYCQMCVTNHISGCQNPE